MTQEPMTDDEVQEAVNQIVEEQNRKDGFDSNGNKVN